MNKQILLSLYKFRYLSIAQFLQLFSIANKNLKEDLNNLLKQNFIKSIKPIISTDQSKNIIYYFLSVKGERKIKDILEITGPLSQTKPKEINDIFLQHHVKNNNVVIKIISSLLEKQREILDYKMDKHCFKKFTFLSNKYYINPDAEIVYKYNEQEIHMFIEMDRSTMRSDEIKEKIGRYYYYITAFKQEFIFLPIIAFVIEGTKIREQSIARWIKQYLENIRQENLINCFYITNYSNVENLDKKVWSKVKDNTYKKLII